VPQRKVIDLHPANAQQNAQHLQARRLQGQDGSIGIKDKVFGFAGRGGGLLSLAFSRVEKSSRSIQR
jgi:hypothetical protein